MKKSHTLNISLTPELAAWIAEQVQAGWYLNASEVVREGLRTLRDAQTIRAAKLADLRAAIEEGMNSPAAEWEGADAIKQLARQRYAARAQHDTRD